ncbi:MAG: type IV secretory system conjugative DNA transfer family protein [Eggerthellaceae bacterium]|nr:type IV secretory system conjugative DNA transfer family protein [Eggerthellaceae bacterium]
MVHKRFNWRAFGSWAVVSAVLAVALCPFAVWGSHLFNGNLAGAPNPIAVYASLDFVTWLADLQACLTVREFQIALLALFAILLFCPFLVENGEVFSTEEREVESGILGDQRVFKTKREVLSRNYTWDGAGKPPVYGLAMGGYPGKQVIIPANHSAIVAPSGSGKTRGSVYETIDALSVAAENSLVVSDPSGEIFAMMGEGLAARGYNVRLLDLNDGKRGERYNPLQAIAERHACGDEDGAEARAVEIGDVLSPEQGGENDYFDRAAAGLIAAVCYLVATLDGVPDDARTLWSVAQTVYKGTDGGSEALKGFIRDQGTDSAAYVLASSFMASSDKTESNILSTVNNVLTMFNAASIKYATGGSEITPSQPMREPTAIFLRTLPKGNQANKLASLYLAQHLAETLRQGDRAALVPTYVIGDEFHAIPRFDLVTAVEQGRKYSLHYYMWVQSLTGFDAFSTKTEDGKEAVLANADVKVLYKAGSVSDAAYFETLGGRRTVRTKSTGTSTRDNAVTDSEGYAERDVANWAQGDLMQRDPYADGVLVFANVSGEAKHNGKFEIPVPDVTATPTARNFATFGSREHESQVISRVEARLSGNAKKIFIPRTWTPDFDKKSEERVQQEHQEQTDEDIFGF